MGFDFDAQTCYLTYSQANNIEDNKQIYDKMILKIHPNTVEDYVIGEEQHQDGNKHFHCYFRFSSRLHTKNVNYFDIEGIHPNIQRPRNKSKVIKYCIKDGKFITNIIGLQIPLRCMIKELKSDKEIMDSYPEQMIKNHRGINYCKNLHRQKRRFKPYVEVRYGDPDTNKTRTFFDTYGYDNSYKKPSGKWWDMYNNEDYVLIDDFEGEIPYTEFKNLVDRYPHKVECKGGFHEFNSKVICFTSNLNPNSWYSRSSFGYCKDAVWRRLDTVIHHTLKDGVINQRIEKYKGDVYDPVKVIVELIE